MMDDFSRLLPPSVSSSGMSPSSSRTMAFQASASASGLSGFDPEFHDYLMHE